MTKILHLEIENCADCPYKWDDGTYATSCSKLDDSVNGHWFTIPHTGILPNCPLEDKESELPLFGSYSGHD